MRIFYILLFILLTVSLSAQKKLLKQAASLESKGQYGLASEKYREVLYRNATLEDATNGLKRTSQKVVDQQLSDYFIARNAGELVKAIEIFEDVLQKQEELKYFNVSIDIPSYYFKDYEKDKEKSEEKSQTIAEAESFGRKEEKYAKAVNLFGQKRLVEAWRIFNSISRFKDSSDYLKRIESYAKRLSITPSIKNQFSSEETLRNSLLSEFFKLDNPLIKIIDRENLDQLIEEQKLGLSGLLDEKSASDLGKLLGVEMMLITRLLNYNLEQGDKTNQTKTAYTASINNNIRDYHPVSYLEHYQKNSLEVSFQYQLIDVATAEILIADIIYEKVEDEVNYATYQGDPTALYPSNGTHIFTKGKERDAFQALFSTPTKPLSKKEMDITIQKSLAKKVADSLDKYFKE